MWEVIMLSMLILLFGLSGSANAAPAERALVPVEHVDLTRYQGKWHEIASIPQFFQRKCVKNTMADYTVMSESLMRVTNSCTTKEDKTISSEGRAKPLDASNAKLKVTFAKIFDQYLFWFSGKYWVIYLEPNYQYAVIGHPTRDYGWILSRTPDLPEDTMKELIHFLKVSGYDPCRFQTTPQDNGLSVKKSLCK
jgi:apolipoprotein D and lipocalin family protein